MKKRAKQLAMLGLTVTMMCGTQMTAFASGLGEEAPVAIETEAKATANEETEEVKVEAKEEKADAKEEVKTEVKEEVVTGTEVAETPVVEETEVKEIVAGTEELVGLGVSVEAEVETEAPAVPQTDVEADAPVVIPETEETNKVAEPKLSVTSNIATFDGTQDIVLTFKVDGLEGDFTWNTDVFSIAGSVVGSIEEQISKNEYRVTLRKDHLLDNIRKQNYKNGQTIEIKAGGWAIEYDDENGERKEFGFPSTFVTYSDGTVTPEPEKPQPEPEKPQPEPEKPQPEPEKPQPDGGNGGTETPDPEQPEKPDGGNGNGEGTQKPDGNEQKPDGNEQKPDSNEQKPDDTQKPDGNEQKPDGNEQKPDGNEQKPDNTQKPEEQKPVSGQQVQTDNTTNKGNAPKTGDPTTALPFMGAGLSSLGVALGAFFKKRK